ncbi:hypothetical protein TthSNM17_22390 (plasmid) [Thermus thermophilus]|nr:hypothetical protein TthSNM17_22390 [Thermus thermophilus]
MRAWAKAKDTRSKTAEPRTRFNLIVPNINMRCEKLVKTPLTPGPALLGNGLRDRLDPRR